MMRRTSRRARAAIGLAAFAFVVLSGCGASTDSTDTSQSAPGQINQRSVTPADSASWLSTAYILVGHREASGTPTSERSREDARALAESLRLRLDDDGVEIVNLAREFSDDSNAAAGGRLGPFRAEEAQAEFAAIIQSLAYDEVSPVVENERGFLIAKRLPVEEAKFQYVLVGFSGSDMAKVERTAEEARELADRARVAALSSRTFESVAEQFSDRDDVTIHTARGMTEPEIADVVFALEPGVISDVCETSYGYLVVKRLK